MNNNPPPNLQEAESQWDEKEMTELAAEILQQRARLNPAEPTASRILFNAILSDQNFVNHQLNWEDLRLPRNRTILSCRGVLGLGNSRTTRHNSMSSYAQPGFAAPSPMINPAPYLPSTSNKRQRPASAESGQILYPPSTGIRLAPKPSFAVQGPSRPQGGSHPPSPLDNPPATGSDHNPTRKKRGRPSKKDVEERRAQAEKLARELAPTAQMMQPNYGSPVMSTQPPFGPFSVQPPLTGPREGPAETSASQSPHLAGITATPRNAHQPEGDVGSSSSSSKKKRGRPPKVDTEAIPAPTFSASGASSAGAYGSPPQSGVSIGSISRRLSVSTRSQGGTTAGPVQQEQGAQQVIVEDLGQQQNRQPRSWNDTVMGNSSINPNLRQPPPQ